MDDRVLLREAWLLGMQVVQEAMDRYGLKLSVNISINNFEYDFRFIDARRLTEYRQTIDMETFQMTEPELLTEFCLYPLIRTIAKKRDKDKRDKIPTRISATKTEWRKLPHG